MGEIFRLVNQTQNYAWGSKFTLAHMRGLSQPSKEPEAEVWVGAHPSAPSLALLDDAKVGLDVLVGKSPERILPPGEKDFPFLFKILAIDAPLSLQVHPTDQQAQEGFARENAQGIDLSSPQRNYKDEHSKPETVIALTPMTILTGVRPETELQEIAEGFQLPWLDKLLPSPSAKDLLASIITLDKESQAEALATTRTGVDKWLASAQDSGLLQPAADLVKLLEEKCPSDPGLLVALAMNLIHLNPGDSAFTPDGQVHAYVSGTAIEIMNPSDNVLRAGLTPKHVDQQELIAILRQDQSAPQILRPQPDAETVGVYSLWNDRMSVTRIRLNQEEKLNFTLHGTATVLGTEGNLTFTSDQTQLTVAPTESILHTGSDTPVLIEGQGEVFIASFV